MRDNRWRALPLLSEEGWLRDQEKSRGASSARADGVVINHQQFLLELTHHPVRFPKDASRYFIDVAATPPRRGGDKLPTAVIRHCNYELEY
jgi:hypothetical protein